MVVGIDVYHDVDGGNSYCGLVGSLNTWFTRWVSLVRPQRDKNMEMIDQLVTMLQEAMVEYKRVSNSFRVRIWSHMHINKSFSQFNDKIPDKIIIYRDGVGDSRLEFTREFEVPQMRRAYDAFGEEADAAEKKISEVIVSKRIITRLLERTGSGGVQNPPPGTVLDHTVTRRHWDDFFLVSQLVSQGTVSPSHYVVLLDEIGLGMDKIQRLTYKLTYMYYNKAQPVKVPAPCLVGLN